MYKVLIASSVLGMLFSFRVFGQAPILYHCGTTEAVEKSLKDHPELLENLQKLDSETKQFITGIAAQDSILTIPVVFHVFHTYGSERISEAQIRDAIRIMNADFQLLNYDTGTVSTPFKSRRGNTKFRFRLAKKDPQGRCTEGINYIYSDLHKSGGENLKNVISWDTKRYLNIWTCSVVASGAAAYSYYPGSAPGTSHEGIVSRADYVGSIGSSNNGYPARTLTHETGHYFNLPHTWGGSNTPGLASNCNIDDGVQDTPNCKGVVNTTCNLNQNSCGETDNVENYMEYSSCRRMFTQGQTTRMQAAINSTVGGRKFMWPGSNLISTGTTNDASGPECPPKADFKNTVSRVCAGDMVTFTELAYNVSEEDSVKFAWTFDGGTPSTSSLKSVNVTYPNTGTFPVKLVASNAAGKDSLVRTDWITVLPTTTGYYTFENESFELATFPTFPQAEKTWGVISTISSTWKRTTSAHVTGVASLMISNSTNSDGSNHQLHSPVFEIADGGSSPKISFKYAFARRTATDNDRLVVSYSTNCGRTWFTAFTKTGAGLATTTSLVTGTFTPASQNWRQENVAMTLLGSTTKFRLKFEFTSGGGNNLYLEDIQITSVTPISNLQDESLALFILPNPSAGLPSLSIESSTDESARIEITDQVGRNVLFSQAISLQNGSNLLNLNQVMDRPKAGSYFVRLILQNRVMVRQWIQLP